MFTVSSTLILVVFTGPTDWGLSQWDPYAMRTGGCLGLYYCNMVEWFTGSGGIQANGDAIDQWRKRLHACVRARRGQFEHAL